MRKKLFVLMATLSLLGVTITSVVIYFIMQMNIGLFMKKSGILLDQVYYINKYVSESQNEIMLFVIIFIVISFFLINMITNHIIKDINENYKSQDYIRALEGDIKNQKNEIMSLHDLMIEEEYKTRYIFNKIHEGLILLDDEKRIIHINESAKNLLNIDKNYDFTGKHMLFAVKSVELNNQLDNILEESKMPTTMKINARYLKSYVNAMVENGKLQGIFCVIVDDTLMYENEFARRTFTTNVTHELKTPLTSIAGYAEIMKNMDVTKEDIKVFSDNIIKNTNKMINMINDIIKLSSLVDINNIEKKKVSLDTVIKKCIKNLEIQAKLKNIDISTNIQEDVFVYANESLMYDMVNNIISNAIKYNVQDGKVMIDCNRDGNKVIFKVRDTGIGISEKYKEKVFERFFTVDKSRSKNLGGSGLGLSIVKHIAKVHNAYIRLDSKENEGTEITVEFNLI